MTHDDLIKAMWSASPVELARILREFAPVIQISGDRVTFWRGDAQMLLQMRTRSAEVIESLLSTPEPVGVPTPGGGSA